MLGVFDNYSSLRIHELNLMLEMEFKKIEFWTKNFLKFFLLIFNKLTILFRNFISTLF